MTNIERDRRELINRLKKVRDPRERDRIIWALAGHEESAMRPAVPTERLRKSILGKAMKGKRIPEKPAASQPETEQQAPVKIPGLPDFPQIPINAKRMMGFVVPGAFTIFGVVYIIQAVLNYLVARQVEREIPRLITGGIFVAIGLGGIFKALHPAPVKKSGKVHQE
jgi:hypothetical protein